MDSRNERKVFDLIVDTVSSANTSQYFLLTPKVGTDKLQISVHVCSTMVVAFNVLPGVQLMVMYKCRKGPELLVHLARCIAHTHMQTCCCPSGGMIVACSFCEFENNHCFCMPLPPHMHVHLLPFPILFITVAARPQVHSTSQGSLHTKWTRVITELTVGHVPVLGLVGTCLDPALVGSRLDMGWFLS